VIVVDTSAIIAVLFGEPGSAELESHLLDDRCVMSAATRVELGIVIEAKKGPAGGFAPQAQPARKVESLPHRALPRTGRWPTG